MQSVKKSIKILGYYAEYLAIFNYKCKFDNEFSMLLHVEV